MKKLSDTEVYKLFKPELSPKKMLELGVFGGSYFGNNIKEYPKSWLVKAKLSKTFDVNINRFKGLGEMMPAQLKETTMSPDNRTLLKVQIASKDKKSTLKSVDALMGKKPELRFKFITENSKKISAENIL